MKEIKLGPQYASATRLKTIQFTADKALLSLFDESITFYLSSPPLHPTPIAVVLNYGYSSCTLRTLFASALGRKHDLWS
jgi:hypothetical protein